MVVLVPVKIIAAPFMAVDYLNRHSKDLANVAKLVPSVAPSLGILKKFVNMVSSFGKRMEKLKGNGLYGSKIKKGIKLKIDKNMPDAHKYIKFLTPSQLNKIVKIILSKLILVTHNLKKCHKKAVWVSTF